MNGRWPKIVLMSGLTAAWLIYDISSATEAPGLALSALQYSLLACALFGFVGSAVMFATGK
jgi:hypothetical protein